jgi:hypothetical protein
MVLDCSGSVVLEKILSLGGHDFMKLNSALTQN